MSIGSSGSSSPSLPSEAPAVERRILLTPYFQKRAIPNRTDGFRMRIVASGAVGLPNEIFRYFQYPPDAVTGEENSESTGVCTAYELEEIPANEPRANDTPKLFRLDYIDVIVESVHVADEAWELYQREVTLLLETLALNDVLEAGDPVWIGTPP